MNEVEINHPAVTNALTKFAFPRIKDNFHACFTNDRARGGGFYNPSALHIQFPAGEQNGKR